MGRVTSGPEVEPATEPLETPLSLGVRLATAMGVRDAGRVLRDFATYFPAQVIPAVAGFLVLPILARQLAPTELGTLAIAQTLVSLGWIVSGQWLTTAVMREYAAHRERGDIEGFSGVLGFGTILTLVLAGVFSLGVLLAGMLSSAVANNALAIIAATTGLLFQNLAVTLFAAALRPRAYAVVDALARTGGIALGTALVFEGYKVHGYLFGLAVASNAIGLVGLLLAWPRVRVSIAPRWQELIRWGRYSGPVVVGGAAFWALLLADRYLLAALKDTAAVGVYSVGAAVGDKAIAIPTFAFYSAARPLLISAYERHGRAEVERLVQSYTRIVLLIGLPTLAMALVSAHAIVPVLAHGDFESYYTGAETVIPIVALGSLIDAVRRVGTIGLGISRNTRPIIYVTLVALAVNVVANLIMIPFLGIKGAAIATPIAAAVMLAGSLYFSRRYLTWHFPVRTLARGLLAAGAGYIAARYAMHLSHVKLAQIGLAAAIGGVVYLLALVVLGERRDRLFLRHKLPETMAG
jgi:O-antigen/teichoic acid export membrane protein